MSASIAGNLPHSEAEIQSEPILVAGSNQRWDCYAIILLGAAAIVGGILCLQIEPIAAVVVGGLGVAGILVGFGVWISRSAQRKWVTITADGFLLQDSGDPHPYGDRDVLCMSLAHKQNYANGVYQSTTRRFTVWLEEPHGHRKLVMTSKLLANTADPLNPLITRISRRLHDDAKQSLAEGHRVEGRGWSLERDVLVVTRGRRADTLRLSDIAAADVFDGAVCVWRHDDEIPAVRVPETGENSHVLLSLLQEHLETHRSENAGEGLGRVLFERRPSWVWMLAGLLLSPLLGLGAAGMAAEGAQKGEGSLLVGAAVCGVIAAGLLLAALASRFSAFRCHERGVVSKKWFGERRLRFDELEAFTFAGTRIYVKGGYAGTKLQLKFEPLPERNARAIKHSAWVQNDDASLALLRDHVSRVIAARLASEWAAGKPVMWTPHLWLFPAGARYQPSGFFGRKAEVFLPYAEMDRWQADDGKFQLWMRGQTKAAISESSTQRNFYPGLTLLLRILNPER